MSAQEGQSGHAADIVAAPSLPQLGHPLAAGKTPKGSPQKNRNALLGQDLRTRGEPGRHGGGDQAPAALTNERPTVADLTPGIQPSCASLAWRAETHPRYASSS